MPFLKRLLLVLLLSPVSLEAQAVRTWVSSTGADINSCSRTSPCRNFGAAINAVAPGGEVVVLDSAGYGPVVITKAVSIISPFGLHGAIAPSSGAAVVINVNLDTDRVNLRGLYLNAQGAQTGIQIVGAKAVHVENCVVSGFAQDGITFNISSGVDFYSPEFYLVDSVIRNNGGIGLDLSANGSILRALVEHSRFDQNLVQGVKVSNQIRVAIRDSVVRIAPGSVAILAFAQASGTSTDLTVENCTLFGTGSSFGISAQSDTGTMRAAVSRSTILSCLIGIHLLGSATTVAISGNTVTHNAVGAQLNTASLVTRANNTFTDNGTGIDGTPLTLPAQ